MQRKLKSDLICKSRSNGGDIIYFPNSTIVLMHIDFVFRLHFILVAEFVLNILDTKCLNKLAVQTERWISEGCSYVISSFYHLKFIFRWNF